MYIVSYATKFSTIYSTINKEENQKYRLARSEPVNKLQGIPSTMAKQQFLAIGI